jgi:hypothetical protein
MAEAGGPLVGALEAALAAWAPPRAAVGARIILETALDEGPSARAPLCLLGIRDALDEDAPTMPILDEAAAHDPLAMLFVGLQAQAASARLGVAMGRRLGRTLRPLPAMQKDGRIELAARFGGERLAELLPQGRRRDLAHCALGKVAELERAV